MAPDFTYGKACLIELADRTHGQLLDLARDVGPDRCDRMLAALREVSSYVESVRAGLLRGSPPEGC